MSEYIKTIAHKRRRFGYRRVHDLLRRTHPGVNHKRVYRLYRQANLAVRKRRKGRRPNDERVPLVAASRVNQTWSMDFVSDSLCNGRRIKLLTVADDFSHECVTIAADFGIGGEYVTRLLDEAARFRGYPQAIRTDNGPDFMRDTLYDGRPFRTLNVIDEGNREVLRIECGMSIPSERVVRVLEQLVEMFGRPEAIRLDNGPELTAEAFVEWAERNGVKLLFIQLGKPNQNAFIERFNRSFRQEVLDAWLFNAVSEVQTAADDWLTDYNEYRPHDSLGNVPPAVFKPRVFNQEVSTSGLST